MFPLLIHVLVIPLLFQLSLQVGKISPTRPPQMAVLNDKEAPLYVIYFSAETTVPTGNYIHLKFSSPVYQSQCQIMFSQAGAWQAATCQADNANSNIFLLLPEKLIGDGRENRIEISQPSGQIQGPNIISIEMKTVNTQDMANQYVFDMNLNFGYIPLTSPLSNYLGQAVTASNIPLVTKLNYTTNVGYTITIPSGVANPIYRLKAVISAPWQFSTDSVFLSQMSMYGSSSTVVKQELLSPSQIEIMLDKVLTPGTQVQVFITNVLTPKSVYTGSSYFSVLLDVLSLFTPPSAPFSPGCVWAFRKPWGWFSSREPRSAKS